MNMIKLFGRERKPVLTWFANNSGTIVVVVILALVVAGILFKMIRDRKQGRSSCGCNCAQCGMGSACRQNKENQKESR